MPRFAPDAEGSSHASEPASGLPGAPPRRLWVVSPCFNRPADVQGLASCLRAIRLLRAATPTLLLVDNASDPPLGAPELPPPWTVRLLRQARNTGGSGGFNAGLRHALSESGAGDDDLVWLLDSDARPHPDALVHLADALALPDVAAAGSTLVDPATGRPFECGGRIQAASGEYVQRPPAGEAPEACDYLAACSILVAAGTVRDAGLLPDLFLNGDDVAWGVRLRRASRRRLLAIPASIVEHPSPDRMRTAARYFAVRSAMAALPEAGVHPAPRALRETLRACTMALTGLPVLAEMHLRGLADADAGRTMGPLPVDLPSGRPDAPSIDMLDLPEPPPRVVSPRGRPADWLAPIGSVAADEHGAWRLAGSRSSKIVGGLRMLARGLGSTAALARTSGAFAHAPPAPLRHPSDGSDLSIVVVAFNRRDALQHTLARLLAAEPAASAEIIVVDNASVDGTPDMVADRFPSVRCIRCEENTGVAAFNRGAEAATRPLLLILDDDSWPDPDGLALASGLLEQRPDIAAVALHPRHPDGGASEWPFARHVAFASERWPVMGCGNLVRATDWRNAGGYCEEFFLYRNDADVALTLSGLGRGVWFDPSWVVWHDSPAASRKSERWCRLATRNWIWMARRHGRGWTRWAGIALGVLAAFRHAGGRPGALRAVASGVRSGLAGSPPPPEAPGRDGWRAMLALRRGRVAGPTARYVGPCRTPPPTSTIEPIPATSTCTSSEPSPTALST
ncbi:MAG: glycosyltransferase [Planctomycetota bacterium]